MRRRVPYVVAVLTAVVIVSGCGDDIQNSGAGNPACTSHYDQIAQAPTRAELEQRLIEQTPRAASVRVISREGDRLWVKVQSLRSRNLMSVEVWQLEDGQWTAEQWSQCID